MTLGHGEPYGPSLPPDDLAVAYLVVHLADAVGAESVPADAQLRLLGHLDLGDEGAGRCLPPREVDAGCLANDASASVAAHEVLGRQRPTVRQLDFDTCVVLREAGHLVPAMNRHLELADPSGQDPLDVVLPQPEAVVVTGRKVADVQGDPGEAPDLSHLSLGEEAIRDPTLVEDLDAARVQTARARIGQLLAGAPLANGHIDTRQRQLSRQHQPRRPSPRDKNSVPGHSPPISVRDAPRMAL
jgi:hypothetical protein